MATPATQATTPRSTLGAIKELTVRSVILGGIITILFTAANVYLGLRVGLTFATSLPAAVISMAILRFFKNHTIVENNIVQTIASAAGTLSAIIFVLPGLVMLGYWKGFPYWTTVAVCFFGGVLGVMYSIPLRRAMVTGSDLPYPEGVAAAEVLKVGDSGEAAEENKKGLWILFVGALASLGYLAIAKMKVAAEAVERTFKFGSGATFCGVTLSMALIGVGHLVGIVVGVAMVVGVIISFFIILPMRTGHLPGIDPLADEVYGVFKHEVRLIGAGVIGVAAIWTLIKVMGPIFKGIQGSMASSRARHAGQDVDITERDLPANVVIGTTLASMLPIGALLWLFTDGTPLQSNAAGLVVLSIIYVLVVGLFVASVCGYMAGLIGASNSPISGVGILVAVSAALLVKLLFGGGHDANETNALIAYTLLTTAVVFGVATISNDNLQDLKTGQLVGATPWKQQVALIIGVAFGSVVIPPILTVMNNSFGFAGAPGVADGEGLSAPQAGLISTLAKGVLGGDLDWGLLGMGALIGCGVILVDELLSRGTHGRWALPPLAVGMGMYLPISLTLTIPIGAVLGLLYDRWAARRANPEAAKRLGTLLATGLIVGESFFGVLYAAIVYFTKDDTAMALFAKDHFVHGAEIVGSLVFVVVIALLYMWTMSTAQRVRPAAPTAPVGQADATVR